MTQQKTVGAKNPKRVLVEALRIIANYPYVSFGEVERPLVPRDQVEYMRDVAKGALEEIGEKVSL
jgi:hypothetical protein